MTDTVLTLGMDAVMGKPKLISNHAWQKHLKLTAKLQSRKQLWTMAKSWKRCD